jgi:Ca2+-binding EF-hand superfamily protein
MISSVSTSTSSNLATLLSSSSTTQKVREQAPKPPDPAEVFNSMDTDGDGSVTETEFTTAMEKMQKSDGSRPPPPDGKEPPSASELFAKIDSDSDGKVSLTELKADFESRKTEDTASTGTEPDLTELFTKLDSDSDGEIGESEFAKLFEAMNQARQQSFGKTYTDTATSSASRDSTSLLGVA